MDQRAIQPAPLADLPAGSSAIVYQILGGRDLHRRLRALGIRPGALVQVTHRRGAGLVVSAGSTRVALGAGIVDKVLVTAASPQSVPKQQPPEAASGNDLGP